MLLTGGRAVLPGLVDAHAHLMSLARARLTLNVGSRGNPGTVSNAGAALRHAQWLVSHRG